MSPAATSAGPQPQTGSSILTDMDSAAPRPSIIPAPSASSRPEPSDRDLPAERSLYVAARGPETEAGEFDTAPAPSCESAVCTLHLTETSERILPEAQRRWAARPVPERLQPIRKARHWIAAHPGTFAQAISPDLARSQADTLIAEVLPLLDAMRFLERNAVKLLSPKKLGSTGRPLWLTGVQAEIHRDPFGHILVIGPANFPLFLPGAQALQALVAGNAVTWKPGSGGYKVAALLAHVLREAGLPRGILHVAEDSVQAAETALAGKPDKVVFTGSFATGRKILNTLAERATPSVMELSGADAVVVLPSADLPLAAKAIAFGLRLNGAEVCMSPRRLVATRATLDSLRPHLLAEVARVPPVRLKSATAKTLAALLEKSAAQGATPLNPVPHPSQLIHAPLPSDQHSTERNIGNGPVSISPILLNDATSDTAIARRDLFAPVLSLIEAPSVLHLPELVNNNPYALSASIFGEPREARALAAQLRVGTVTINDLIAPTADPRIPFGGRAASGFGSTRGADGLLEMTAPKSILMRRKGTSRHYDPLVNRDLPFFAGLIGAIHAGSWKARLHALRNLVSAARTFRTKPIH